MIGKRFVLTGVRATELQNFEVPEHAGFGECLVRIEHSLVSPGTELLSYRSYAGPAAHCPGYTAVGRVIMQGQGFAEDLTGKSIFFFPTLADMTGCHASHKLVLRDAIWVPIPNGLDPAKACFARMINVAMTPFCHYVSRGGTGVALVVGLGIVGNIAAQIARLRGFEVIGVDPDKARRDRALQVGIDHVIDPTTSDTVAKVKALSRNQGADFTINATGLASTFMTSVEATGPGGEVSTLGGARGQASINLADLLHKHVQGRQITLRGGWEVLLPRTGAVGSQTPSTQDNLNLAMSWLVNDKIKVDPLWTHRLKPEGLAEAYRALDAADGAYQGVTVDWQ